MTKAERHQVLRDAEVIRRAYYNLGTNPTRMPLRSVEVKYSMAELIAMAEPDWGSPDEILDELIEAEEEMGIKYPR